MSIAWAIVLILLGLLAWLGQVTSWLAPALAARLGLIEEEATVDPAFWADVRGEAAWDSLTLWTLPLAGFLLLFDAATWPHWGLIGGGVYVYFGGRGVFTRVAARSRRVEIGPESAVRSAFVILPLWLTAGLVTVIAALNAL